MCNYKYYYLQVDHLEKGLKMMYFFMRFVQLICHIIDIYVYLYFVLR